METSRTGDESLAGLSGKGTDIEGELGVLGKTARPSAVSVCSKTPSSLMSWSLRPTDLARLLNSTPLGEVIGEREIYRHRTRAGSRISVGRQINVCRYVSWLREMHHTPRMQGKPRNGNFSARSILELLAQQGHRCALTGRQLTPNTAALDHVTPISRGGEHRIENAQILHKVVNRAKGTLTNEEFTALCREVVAYTDQNNSTPQVWRNESVTSNADAML